MSILYAKSPVFIVEKGAFFRYFLRSNINGKNAIIFTKKCKNLMLFTLFEKNQFKNICEVVS